MTTCPTCHYPNRCPACSGYMCDNCGAPLPVEGRPVCETEDAFEYRVDEPDAGPH